VRKWERLTADLDHAHATPLFLQLATAIAGDVRHGRLRPGDALPGTRALAERLGVHRSTVLAAYRELVAEGVLHARWGGGTFVAEPAEAIRQPPESAPAAPRTPSYTLSPPLPLPPMTPPDPPGAFMLFRAVPDVRLLPAEALARAFRRALARHGRRLLGYADPRGHERLRTELATMLSHTRALATTADDVFVMRGSQQGLYLVAQALLSPGDAVAVEELGNPAAWAALRQAGAELLPLPVDDQGLDVDALVALLERRTLRAIYVTPHHQFPTNAVMATGRRARLAALAAEHRFAIIEDDYDHEFHYEGRPLPPIAAGTGRPSVIYLGSLSKVLAPGLRVGYVVAPHAVLERLASLRAICDMQGDAVVECAIAELFEDGDLLRHVLRMRQTYARRRDALAAALTEHLAGALAFRVPDGGMAIWARVQDGIDVDAWSRAGATKGVLFRGAGMFDFASRELPFLRLGFTYHDEAELSEAASRMARALETAREAPRRHGRASRTARVRAVTTGSADAELPRPRRARR
jgi:GntR family transcriptional regulator/MocR family aminotransferase